MAKVSTNPATGRRQDILDEFVKLVAEHGYEATNFSEISAKLDISKGTIVHHFVNKRSLMVEAKHTISQRHFDVVSRLVGGFDRPHMKLASYIYFAVGLYRVDRHAVIAATRETLRFLDDPCLHGLFSQWLKMPTSIIEAGVFSGEFKCSDPQLSASCINGMTQWMWTWFNPADDAEVDKVAAEAIHLILRGVMSDPGDYNLDEVKSLAWQELQAMRTA